jgi:hypothetical protein
MKLLLSASLTAIVILASSSASLSADSCVTLKNGKKMCGKPMLGGIFKEVQPNYCLIYTNGKQGLHVDCKNPKKKLSNAH